MRTLINFYQDSNLDFQSIRTTKHCIISLVKFILRFYIGTILIYTEICHIFWIHQLVVTQWVQPSVLCRFQSIRLSTYIVRIRLSNLECREPIL